MVSSAVRPQNIRLHMDFQSQSASENYSEYAPSGNCSGAWENTPVRTNRRESAVYPGSLWI